MDEDKQLFRQGEKDLPESLAKEDSAVVHLHQAPISTILYRIGIAPISISLLFLLLGGTGKQSLILCSLVALPLAVLVFLQLFYLHEEAYITFDGESLSGRSIVPSQSLFLPSSFSIRSSDIKGIRQIGLMILIVDLVSGDKLTFFTWPLSDPADSVCKRLKDGLSRLPVKSIKKLN